MGEQGAMGPAGSPGSRGPAGDPGEWGDMGEKGYSGPPGTAGSPGAARFALAMLTRRLMLVEHSRNSQVRPAPKGRAGRMPAICACRLCRSYSRCTAKPTAHLSARSSMRSVECVSCI